MEKAESLLSLGVGKHEICNNPLDQGLVHLYPLHWFLYLVPPIAPTLANVLAEIMAAGTPAKNMKIVISITTTPAAQNTQGPASTNT